jgi:hypothetical protein
MSRGSDWPVSTSKEDVVAWEMSAPNKSISINDRRSGPGMTSLQEVPQWKRIANNNSGGLECRSGA